MRSPRQMLSIIALAKQMFGKNFRAMLQAYEDATREVKNFFLTN